MISDLFWMDGYGPHVWAAWCFAGILLKFSLLRAVLRDRRRVRELARWSAQTASDRDG